MTAITLSGLYIAGFLVLLESTTQVCVYHGFLGTHESSSGGRSTKMSWLLEHVGVKAGA